MTRPSTVVFAHHGNQEYDERARRRGLVHLPDPVLDPLKDVVVVPPILGLAGKVPHALDEVVETPLGDGSKVVGSAGIMPSWLSGDVDRIVILCTLHALVAQLGAEVRVHCCVDTQNFGKGYVIDLELLALKRKVDCFFCHHRAPQLPGSG
jgi:hypothetical protein